MPDHLVDMTPSYDFLSSEINRPAVDKCHDAPLVQANYKQGLYDFGGRGDVVAAGRLIGGQVIGLVGKTWRAPSFASPDG